MVNNKLVSLVEIFNQKFFRIPDYQRGYAWTQQQLEDFWEDLDNLKPDKFHYTGLLTVEPIGKEQTNKDSNKWADDLWLIEKGLKPYYVIDGQQRLTTCVILLDAILKKFKDDEGINFQRKSDWVYKFLYQEFKNYKSYLFGYEKDNPSDEFFKTKILEQESLSSDKVPEHTYYTRNLKYAKGFFEKKIDELSKEDVEKIFKKVVNSFKFNFYEIDDELDVFITFETMNNRGKPLSKLELLKNRLIYLTTILNPEDGDNEKLRKDINEAWKTIYEFLGKNETKILEDDDFLRDHWIMYFKYDRKEAETYAKFLLNEKFTAKNVINNNPEVRIGFKKIKDYVESIAGSVKCWFYIFNPNYSNYSEEIKVWLRRLNKLGFGAFTPLIMAAMVKNVPEEKLKKLLEVAEKFVFLVFDVSGSPSNTMNSHFYRTSHDFYKDEKKWDIDSVIKNINDLIYDENDGSGWLDTDLFLNHVQKMYERDLGFYSWKGLKYFLYEYEEDLQNKAKGSVKISWEEFNKRKKEETIEHIYPQTPNKECWKIGFDKFDNSEKNKLVNSLGNLLLLSKSKNSSMQNDCFVDKKKQKNNETGYFNGSYSEIEVAQNEDWTFKEILNRGLKLLKFMEDRWDFEIGSEEKKKKLLHLDFLDQMTE